MSPLAEGADQLVAEVVLELNLSLDVPSPMSLNDHLVTCRLNHQSAVNLRRFLPKSGSDMSPYRQTGVRTCQWRGPPRPQYQPLEGPLLG